VSVHSSPWDVRLPVKSLACCVISPEVTWPPVGRDVVLGGGLVGLILGFATGTGVGRRSNRSVLLTTPGCVLLSLSSTWFSSIDSSQSRLGDDLLSLSVVDTGVGEVGELIRGVRLLLLKVVVALLSEAGDKVSVDDGWFCEGWGGLVVLGGELVFRRLVV